MVIDILCSATGVRHTHFQRKTDCAKVRKLEMLTKLREKNQLTLPAEVVQGAHVGPGDYFEVEATEEGILLRPKKVIDATQAWFWTAEWQAGEREASADIADGRVAVHDSDDAFLASLGED